MAIPTNMLANVLKAPFSLVIVMMLLVLLVGANVIYGEQATIQSSVLMVYAIMFLMIRSDIKKTEHKSQTIIQALPMFLGAFFVTVIIMILIQPFIGATIAASTIETGIAFVAVFGLIHGFVKAYIEEEVFRGRLSTIIGEYGQVIAFGLFHFFILYMTFGISPQMIFGVIFLGILGFAWGKLEDVGGLAASTGSHYGYNLAAYGMLPLVLGMVAI